MEERIGLASKMLPKELLKAMPVAIDTMDNKAEVRKSCFSAPGTVISHLESCVVCGVSNYTQLGRSVCTSWACRSLCLVRTCSPSRCLVADVMSRYIIGADGKIAYKGGLGPDDYNIPEMALHLTKMQAAAKMTPEDSEEHAEGATSSVTHAQSTHGATT